MIRSFVMLGVLALVHREYRRAPHPSFMQPNPLLPTAVGVARPPELGASAVSGWCCGTKSAAARLFPRGTPAL